MFGYYRKPRYGYLHKIISSLRQAVAWPSISLLRGVESGETDVTFAVGAETDSGSAGNIGLAQTLLEKFPGSPRANASRRMVSLYRRTP